MAANASRGLDEVATAWHHWCQMRPAEQLIVSAAPVSPLLFAAFLVLLFRRPLNTIGPELAFFATAQRVLLSLEALELAGYSVSLLNIRIFRLAFGRAILLFLFFTGTFTMVLITKLYLIGLTALRIYAIHQPLRFVALDHRRCLSTLLLVSVTVSVAIQLAIYRLAWGGSLTSEWTPRSNLRLPSIIRTYAWCMAVQAAADLVLAPASVVLAVSVRRQRRRRRPKRRSGASEAGNAATNRAILAESLTGILVTTVMTVNALNASLSGDRRWRRLRPWIYMTGASTIVVQKLASVLVPVITCRKLREEIFALPLISSPVWSRKIPPLLRFMLLCDGQFTLSLLIGGFLRWMLPDCSL